MMNFTIGKSEKVMRKGKFITLEGGEGTGKSTQAALLCEAMKRSGLNAVAVRSPGGTLIAEKLRSILKTKETEDLTPETELLLFGACHSQMFKTLLEPELEKGTIIISDRFFDSTTVYQGYARGLDPAMIETINRFSCRGLKPDLTIVLDIPPELGIARSLARGGAQTAANDRFDSENLMFHTAVRNGFLKLAEKEPDRFRIISAEPPADIVANSIRECVNHELGLEIL